MLSNPQFNESPQNKDRCKEMPTEIPNNPLINQTAGEPSTTHFAVISSLG